jgi:hypothetical protein
VKDEFISELSGSLIEAGRSQPLTQHEAAISGYPLCDA